MSRSQLVGRLVRSGLQSLVAQTLPCCLTVYRWSILLFQRCRRWRLPVGGPDSWWLCPVLRPLSGGTVLRTTSLGAWCMPLYSSRHFRKNDLLFKTTSAWTLSFRIWNLCCNNFNYHYTLSISMFICLCLRIIVSSRIPWSLCWQLTPSFLRWGCHILHAEFKTRT
jgi:hypothetical protein